MAEAKSPLLEKEIENTPRPDYSPEEEQYLSGLHKRIALARDGRDKQRDEWDGMDYVTQYQLNERMANTQLQPKKNKEDTNFQSGTVRTKLFALLSALVNLNLSGDISAFESEGLEIQGLGDAMEDIILKTNEYDNDDEKKYLRHYELLKHGTVFVEELWDKRKKKQKKITKKFNGKIADAEWDTKLKDAFARPTRQIVSGLNVYLGDITKYDISEQPFIFTVDTKPYEEAKTVFGEWERWKNVPRKLQQFNAGQTDVLNVNWRVLESEDERVEIVRYQDKWNNEFAVLLNGVLMTPVGLPLPWGYEEYNIAQQNLEPIHSQFAYGKSLVSRIRNKVALLDELLRLAVLKTQKSFMPPYLNISGKILSNRVFMPGKISHGIPPNTLMPINDKETQGVSQAEMAIIKEIQESINMETTSPIFQGQQSSGDPTATEIIELQRQAKMVLGLTVFAVSMLEWKLEWLRLKNLLANWFQPEGDVVDQARGVLKSKYRQVAVDRPIDDEGEGRRIIIPTKEIPSSRAIRDAEDALSEEQRIPVRLLFINPEQVCSSKLVWQIVVKPKERKTSEVSKLLFRSFMQDVLPLGPNIAELQNEAATVWEKDPKKLFAPNPEMPMDMEGEEPSELGLPTPEGMAGQQMRNMIGANA